MNNFDTKNKIKTLVKSIHYNNDEIIIEDLFDNKINYNATYDDVNTLLKAQKISVNSNQFDFKDIDNKTGFVLTNKHNMEMCSQVTRVKTLSYLQDKKHITSDNNVEMQIFCNLYDIKRILLAYMSNVQYIFGSTLDSESQKTIFNDFIGYTATKDMKNLDAYMNDTKIDKKIKKEFLKNLSNSLKNKKLYSQLDNSDNKKVNSKNDQVSFAEKNPFEIWKFFHYGAKYQGFLNKPQFEQLTNLLNEFEQANKRYVYNFAHPKTHQNAQQIQSQQEFKDILDFLHEKFSENSQQLMANMDETLDDLKQPFEYLKLLSSVRQLLVHNQSINDLVFNSTNGIDENIRLFKNNFNKNNQKYFHIFQELYEFDVQKYSFMNNYEKFFDFMLFDDGKNIGINIRKIVANSIKSEMGQGKIESLLKNKILSSQNLSEFMCKLKTTLSFYLYALFNFNNKIIQQCLVKIKQCRNENEKDNHYKLFQNDYLSSQTFCEIVDKVVKYVGKQNLDEIRLNSQTEKVNLNTKFFKLVYVMSKFLTVKEANDLFSQVITKLDSVIDLQRIASCNGIRLNDSTFDEFSNILEISDAEKTQEIKTELQLLKSLRLKDNPITKDKSLVSKLDFSNMLNCFKLGSYTKEQFEQQMNLTLSGKNVLNQKGDKKIAREVKPLKQFLRNNIFPSKQYQYIVDYAKPSVCCKIMEQESIIDFVINKMYNDGENMKKYLSRVYRNFDNPNNPWKDNDAPISQSDLTVLKKEIYKLSFDDISKTIFKKTQKNYTVLAKLYLDICYQVIKNLVKQNASVMIALQEYEYIYSFLTPDFEDNKIDYNEKIILDYKMWAEKNLNKKSKSLKQIDILLNSAEFEFSKQNVQRKKDGEKSRLLEYLTKAYRNGVEHLSCVANPNIFDAKIERVSSYFALYQIIVFNYLKKIIKSRLENGSEILQSIETQFNTRKQYSTRFVRLINLPFAYNMSRFNNLTLEKYAQRNG